MSEYIIDLGQRSKNASAELNKVETVAKDNFFGILIKNLDNNRDKIKSENAIDIKDGEKKGLTKAFLDRLLLTDSRIDGMIEGIEVVKNFRDPIGEIVEGFSIKLAPIEKPIYNVFILTKQRY